MENQNNSSSGKAPTPGEMKVCSLTLMEAGAKSRHPRATGHPGRKVAKSNGEARTHAGFLDIVGLHSGQQLKENSLFYATLLKPGFFFSPTHLFI